MKNLKYFLLTTITILFLQSLAMPAAAFVVRSGDQIVIQKDETIDDNLVIAGRMVDINGNVNGDVICAGQNISINGNVNGDVICAGQNINILNNIGGSIRVAAQNMNIAGQIGRNATIAGQTIKSDSQIQGEMLFASQTAEIAGRVGRDIAGAAQSITINGNIGRNAQLRDNNLYVRNGAAINGSLTYVSVNKAIIDPGSRINNGTYNYQPAADERMAALNPNPKTAGDKLLGEIIKLLLYIMFALLFAYLFKNIELKAIGAMLSKTWRSLGFGILILLLAPVIAILLAITLIGIPFAIVIALMLPAAIFLSLLIAATAVGRLIVPRYLKSKRESLPVQAAVGAIVLWLVSEIPVIGGIMIAIVIIWGLGGIYYIFKKDIKQDLT